jgi:imidazole glycerol-phosphate synthase subunit HisH
MITIVDYGVGNVSAFENVFKRLNIPVKAAKTANELLNAKKLILPGVGSFDHAMNQLNESGMRTQLDELVLQNNVPVIGICVGMQMMGNRSEEGKLDGLKWIDSDILKFDSNLIRHRTKLPHMGWNNVDYAENHPLFQGLEKNALFYFLHSYYFGCRNDELTIASTYYGNSFSSAVQQNNIFGIQFHPEKSHENGEKLLHNFAKL